MGRSSRVTLLFAGLAVAGLSLACLGCQPVSAVDQTDTQAMVASAILDAGVDVRDVAAVVSGTVITQQDADAAVAAERTRAGLEDDADWEAYLASSGITAWDYRAGVIASMVDDELVRQEAARLGIDVSNRVDEQIASVEELYPSHASFVAAIEDKGYTEQSYRDAVEDSLLCAAVRDMVIEAPTPTEEQVGQYAEVVAPLLAGKRSSCILIGSGDYATAREVKRQLDEGEDFAELAREYSIDQGGADGGDAGWDSLNTFLPAYQEALDKLEVGEISGIVSTRFGFYIIMCTDQYDAPVDDEGDIDLTAIPDDLRDWILSSMSSTLAGQAFEAYLDNLEATVPIAVFNAEGEQVSNDEVGLATEEVEAEQDVDALVQDVQQSVQEATEQGAASITSVINGVTLSDGSVPGVEAEAAGAGDPVDDSGTPEAGDASAQADAGAPDAEA